MTALGRILNAKILIIFLILLTPRGVAASSMDDALLGVELSEEKSSYVDIYNVRVNFTFKSDNEKHTIKYIEDSIYGVSRIVFEYLERSKLKYRDSKPNVILDIYEVRLSVLNNNDRFSKNVYYPNADVIFGIWEPLNDDLGRVAILISFHDFDLATREIISHEIGHYWYDRLSLSDTTNISHEEFAKTIEKLYLNSI